MATKEAKAVEMAEEEAAEVLILGGGPAGVVLARRLAALGLPVALVSAPRPPAWEGMSPRVVEGLRRAGCTEAVAAAGEPARRTARWDGRTSDLNGEHVVERAALDAALLRDAAAAGVRIVAATVAGVRREDGGGWRALGTAGDRLAAGRFLVEARGRRAPHAGPAERGLASGSLANGGLANGGPAADSGPRTVAVGRLYAGTPNAATGLAASAAASFGDGWAWMAALPDRRRLVQFVIDAGTVSARGGLTALHESLAGAVPEAAAWVAGAEPVGEATARDATAVLRAGLVGPDHLRVGDAAFAIDPLSGHGVYEAVGGAFAAAAAINTLRTQPDSLALVRRFVEERCAETFAHAAAIGRAFYRQETRWPDRPFWRDRAAWPDQTQPAAAAGIRHRAVVIGDRVEERAVLVTPSQPRGVLTIEGVELVPLLRMVREQGDVRGADVAGRLGCAVERVETALAWLRHHRFLDAAHAS